jgi:hypothetical protein
MVESKKVGWIGHVAHKVVGKERRNLYRVLVGSLKERDC